MLQCRPPNWELLGPKSRGENAGWPVTTERPAVCFEIFGMGSCCFFFELKKESVCWRSWIPNFEGSRIRKLVFVRLHIRGQQGAMTEDGRSHLHLWHPRDQANCQLPGNSAVACCHQTAVSEGIGTAFIAKHPGFGGCKKWSRPSFWGQKLVCFALYLGLPQNQELIDLLIHIDSNFDII